MNSNDNGTIMRVGLLLIIGLSIIATLTVYFGRLDDGFKKFYYLTVDYQNASGIIQGADVLLAGAKIGCVAQSPKILPNMLGVSVLLKIEANVKIPKNSIFGIGSAGLLSDKFIVVHVDNKIRSKESILPNSMIEGESNDGLDGLERQIQALMPSIKNIVQNFDHITDNMLDITSSLKQNFINKKNIHNIQDAIKNMSLLTTQVNQSSTNFDKIINKTDKLLQNGNRFMNTMQVTANEFKIFTENLRDHGILFYRNAHTK